MLGAEHAGADVGQVPVVRLGRLAQPVHDGGQPALDRQRRRVLRAAGRGHDRVRPAQLTQGLGQVAQAPGERGQVDHERGQPGMVVPEPDLTDRERVLQQRPGPGQVPRLGPLPGLRVRDHQGLGRTRQRLLGRFLADSMERRNHGRPFGRRLDPRRGVRVRLAGPGGLAGCRG